LIISNFNLLRQVVNGGKNEIMVEVNEQILIDAYDITLGKKELWAKFLMDIINSWQAKGWDNNQLPYYITQRFGRPIEQLSLAELRVIKNELV